MRKKRRSESVLQSLRFAAKSLTKYYLELVHVLMLHAQAMNIQNYLGEVLEAGSVSQTEAEARAEKRSSDKFSRDGMPKYAAAAFTCACAMSTSANARAPVRIAVSSSRITAGIP